VSYAALILAHRHPSQVERLAERLGCPTWVQYDRRSPAEEHRRLGRSHSLHTVDRPGNVVWGHWSLVAAMLRGLATVDGDPDHILVLSGDAYPIKPPRAIAERLSEPVSFVHHTALPRPKWRGGGLDRVEHVWIAQPGRRRNGKPLLRLPLRRRRPRIPLYGGSGWFVLHRDARELLLDRRATKPARRALRWARLPEEMFVQTALANSPLSSRLVNRGLHFTDWSSGGRSPGVLTETNWAALVESPALFARKFAPDDPLLDRIDRELLAWQKP
jgi:hypothetical protein